VNIATRRQRAALAILFEPQSLLDTLANLHEFDPRHWLLAHESSARYGYPPGFLARYFACQSRGKLGAEEAASAVAALLFWWPAFERQVRIEGRVAVVSPVARRPIEAWTACRSGSTPAPRPG